MKRLLITSFSIVLLFFTACSSSDSECSSSDSETKDLSISEYCTQSSQKFCEKFFECSTEEDREKYEEEMGWTTQGSCTKSLVDKLGCEYLTRCSDPRQTYHADSATQCIEELTAIDCEPFVELFKEEELLQSCKDVCR